MIKEPLELYQTVFVREDSYIGDARPNAKYLISGATHYQVIREGKPQHTHSYKLASSSLRTPTGIYKRENLRTVQEQKTYLRRLLKNLEDLEHGNS